MDRVSDARGRREIFSAPTKSVTSEKIGVFLDGQSNHHYMVSYPNFPLCRLFSYNLPASFKPFFANQRFNDCRYDRWANGVP